VPTGDFVMDTSTRLPAARLKRSIADAVGAGADLLDATAIAAALLGDSIATNPFLLGYAWQRGLIPLSLESLLEAIRLNGTAVEANIAAFEWGRIAAHDLPRVQAAAGIVAVVSAPRTLDDVIATHARHLTAYQNRKLARRYTDLVARVRESEGRAFSGSTVLTEAVARGYHKLLAYKDEYEVARLYSTAEFRAQLAAQFETPEKIELYLAPPLIARRDPATGHLLKQKFGPWMLKVFAVMAPLKVLRGSRFDLFGRTDERRAERALIAEYEADIEDILRHLSGPSLPVAVLLAGLPERIRGFGHVKERAMREAAEERVRLIERLHAPMAMAAE
jgi:indolepyruvate ferredoxin oxidoreductase